jgi:hypothetical protein
MRYEEASSFMLSLTALAEDIRRRRERFLCATR